MRAFAVGPQDRIRIATALYGVFVAPNLKTGRADNFLVHPPAWLLHKKVIDPVPRLRAPEPVGGIAPSRPRTTRNKNLDATQLRHTLLVATDRTFHDMSSFRLLCHGKSPS
jgi:hypothetical protein